MPFFVQISKVQYFISTLKPSFKHFINILNNPERFLFTSPFLESKKIFTL